MGMDIWPESGVLVDVGTMIGLVTEKNYGTMRDVLMKQLGEAKESAEQEVVENAERLTTYEEESKTWPEKEKKQEAEWAAYYKTIEELNEAGNVDQANNLPAPEFLNEPSDAQYSWQADQYETLNELMKPLLDNDSVEGVTEVLSAYSETSGEVEDRYDECEAMHGELACEAWNVFLENEYPKVPTLESVRAFGASRISGGEVPVGVVVYVFSEDECYEKIPTEAGKELFDVVGDIEPSKWTIYSI